MKASGLQLCCSSHLQDVLASVPVQRKFKSLKAASSCGGCSRRGDASPEASYSPGCCGRIDICPPWGLPCQTLTNITSDIPPAFPLLTDLKDWLAISSAESAETSLRPNL